MHMHPSPSQPPNTHVTNSPLQSAESWRRVVWFVSRGMACPFEPSTQAASPFLALKRKSSKTHLVFILSAAAAAYIHSLIKALPSTVVQ